MEILWILIFFFAFCLMAFVAIALLFPEWVGITGKKAKDIQKHQETEIEVPKSEALKESASPNSPPKDQ